MDFSAPPPAIILPGEPWEREAHEKLARLGVPRHVRRAVVTELKRLAGVRARIIRPEVEELARYARLPVPETLSLLPGGLGVKAVGGKRRRGGVTPATITYLGSADMGGTSGSGAFSFTSFNFGTATADRRIVIMWGYRVSGGGTITGITTGGVANTNVRGGSLSGENVVQLTIANVPTGTSGTIAFTLSAHGSCGCDAWAIYGLQNDTATDSSTVAADNPSYALDVNAGGVAVAGFFGHNGAGWSISGLANTGVANHTWDSNKHQGAFHEAFATAQLNLTITGTSTNSNEQGCFASFGGA